MFSSLKPLSIFIETVFMFLIHLSLIHKLDWFCPGNGVTLVLRAGFQLPSSLTPRKERRCQLWRELLQVQGRTAQRLPALHSWWGCIWQQPAPQGLPGFGRGGQLLRLLELEAFGMHPCGFQKHLSFCFIKPLHTGCCWLGHRAQQF